MKKLALIGHSISHSRSPLIYEYWFQKHGIPGNYGLIDVHTLKEVDFTDGEYYGFNVTMPFKQEILKRITHLAPEAKAIGAINTLLKTPEGLKGFNTDALGVKSLLKGPYKKAVIVGTGGGSKAITWALQGLAENIIFLSTSGKGPPLEVRHKIIEGADLLANASPLGMKGFPVLEWELASLAPSATVMEMVYAPRQTSLLKAASDREDLHIIDGLKILIAQAKFCFEIWTGIFPEEDEGLHEALMP